MFLETHKTDGLSIYTYLFGCGNEAAIIDPTRDTTPLLQRLKDKNVQLKYIFETHIHADFLSGARQLARDTGAQIINSGEGLNGPTVYDYPENTTAVNGSRYKIGNIEIQAIHTPGHTPEHMSYLLTDHLRASEPIMFFTGDFLFVGSIGRPDLLGGDTVTPLAEALYQTLFEGPVSALPDHLLVLPGHGSGSSCGKAIGDVANSTLGTERRFNEAFQFKNRKKDFIDYILKDQPAAPRYFSTMKKWNKRGPDILDLSDIRDIPQLSFNEFRKLTWDESNHSIKKNTQVIDLRMPTAFAGGHIPGSISIWYSNNVSNWAGWTLDFSKEIYLIHDNDNELEDAVRQLRLVGFDAISGYLDGGFDAWQTSGLPIGHIHSMDVHELDKAIDQNAIKILDVRTPMEYQDDHIEGAIPIETGYLIDNLDQLNREDEYAIICGGGYRASLAASLLKRNGFHNIYNVLGGMSAWNDRVSYQKVEL